MTEVSYAPRAQIAQWLRKGWRLIPDHDYDHGDWAVVMTKPLNPPPLSDDDIWQIAGRFKRGKPPMMLYSNNKSRGRISSQPGRNAARWEGKVYDKILRRLVPA
jgi:hypothetical protein